MRLLDRVSRIDRVLRAHSVPRRLRTRRVRWSQARVWFVVLAAASLVIVVVARLVVRRRLADQAMTSDPVEARRRSATWAA